MDATHLTSIVPQGGLYRLSSLKTVIAESIDHGVTELIDDVVTPVARVPVDLEIFVASS